MRVSASLSPVPNRSSSGTLSNEKPDAYTGPHVSSEVFSTNRSTHGVRKSVTAEESSEIHPNCRSDSLEFSEEYPVNDYLTCTENRKIDTLPNRNSSLVTCGDHLRDAPASKGMAVVVPINMESSTYHCAKSAHTSGYDDGNVNTDGDFRVLSSIFTLGHSKNEESVPVDPNSSVPSHNMISLPRRLSFLEGSSEQNVYAQTLPTQCKSMTTKVDKQMKSLGEICNLPSASCSTSLEQNFNKSDYTCWQQRNIKHQTEPLHDKVSLPLTSKNLVSSNGFHNNMDGSVADLDRSFGYSNMLGSGNVKLISNVAKVENYTTPEVGEDCIISKIISMELDPWQESLTSPDSFSKLLRQTKEQSASINSPSLRKITDNNQSRFSFARQEDFSNQASLLDDSLGSIMDWNKSSAHHEFNAINDLCIDSYQNPYSFNFCEESNNLLNNQTYASSNLSGEFYLIYYSFGRRLDVRLEEEVCVCILCPIVLFVLLL